MNFAATPIPFTVIGAFESRPVCDGAEPGLAKSGAAGLTALRRRWPLFDLRARKVSGQRSGLEAHGARPVWAARGGLDGGGEAGCASAAARRRRRAGLCVGLCWPKQRLRRRQEAGEGSGAGVAYRPGRAVRVDGLRVYACLAAGAFQYTVSTCTSKLHAGSMSCLLYTSPSPRDRG